MCRDNIARAFVLALILALGSGAQADPVYTSAQAKQGQDQFEHNCARCHGKALEGSQFGPPLKGEDFQGRWAGKALADMFYYIRSNMPPTTPGSISHHDLAALLAYIMQENGVMPGDQPLPDSYEGLQAMLALDFWKVVDITENKHLLLFSQMRLPGKAFSS